MNYFQQNNINYFYNNNHKNMQYLAAYTLASLSGKEPTKDQLSNILKATGQKFDEAEVTKVVESLKGKKLQDLIKAGSTKMGSVGGSSSAPVKSSAPAKKQQPKKEVKKQEPKVEEEDDFGGADLFG